jgi:hypothetical protein
VICSLGRKANKVMKLQSEYGDSLPICPVCTLEEVRHLLGVGSRLCCVG